MVEQHHFGIVQVGLLANEQNQPGDPATNGHGDGNGHIGSDATADPPIPVVIDTVAEGKQLHHEVHERLPDLVLRNRYLTRRIRKAAVRAIAPARVLPHAQPPSDDDTAARIMAEVSAVSAASPTTAKRPFPILELPPEVLNHIVRHCSQDPYAFTGSQFARLRAEAASREELGRMVRLRQERLKGIWDKEERQAREREMRDDWLRRGKWDKWEAGGGS